jgi:hypothetical protein
LDSSNGFLDAKGYMKVIIDFKIMDRGGLLPLPRPYAIAHSKNGKCTLYRYYGQN